MTESKPASPRDDAMRAWEVALNPREATELELTDLFQRGYNTYLEDGERNETRMIDDVEEFVLRAVDDPPSMDEVEANPSVAPGKPGRLVVFATMGSMLLMQNPDLQEHHRKIIYHERVEELFFKHALVGVKHYGGGDYELQRLAAEIVYKREHDDEYGSPPGRVVTAITKMPRWGDELYIEIPMVHAGMNTDIRNSSNECICGGDNNCVYVPVRDFERQFKDHVLGRNGTAEYLGKRLQRSMGDGQIDYAVAKATHIGEHIDHLLEIGHTQKLFAERTHPDKLRVILRAVDEVSDDTAQLKKWHSAGELYEALEYHAQDTDNSWDQRKINEIDSARSLAHHLRNHEDHQDVDIHHHHDDRENDDPDNESFRQNMYRLRFNESDATTIQVSEIEDILELPCMQNIHNFLLEEKPVRFVLYTYVRVILSVENDFTVEEIVDWFRQYPWFDEETTRYQARYEKNQTNENDEPYQPVNCYSDNEEFTQFCIGIGNCEYEIHESLPLKDEVIEAKKKS